MLGFFILPCRSLAQYQLSESGFSVGGGYFRPQGNDRLSGGISATGQGFFTHYFCGTRTGYHLEGGFNYVGFKEAAVGQDAVVGATDGGTLSQLRLGVGAYLKVRPVNYHRKQEIALLIGPKAWVAVSSGPGGVKGRTFQPALHVSLWWRFPLNKNHGLFLQPGAEWAPVGPFDNTQGSLNVFLQAGLSLWRSL